MAPSNVHILHPTSPPLAGYLRLQDLGLPLVLDMAGGFAGLSALAFGAFGGISHGAGQRESFDLAHWRRPPNGKGARARTRAAACMVTRICSRMATPTSSRSAVASLRHYRRFPPSRRAENFLLRQLDPAVRSTRQASKLKFGDKGVQKLVVDAKSRLTRLRDALGVLHEADGATAPTSASPPFRGSRPSPGGVSVIQGGRS